MQNFFLPKSGRIFLSWNKCVLFLAFMTVLAFVTKVWVPLWLLSLFLWIFGLYLAHVQSLANVKETDFIIPRERAKLLEKNTVIYEECEWNNHMIFKFHLKRLPLGFKRPYDKRIVNAMSRSLGDALSLFEGSTGYTFGQKSYIIFAKKSRAPERLLMCKLKIEAVSAISSFLTNRFRFHILEEKFDEYESTLKTLIEKKCPFYFCGNVIVTESSMEVLNYMMNACYGDCREYAIGKLCSIHFVPGEISDLDKYQKLSKLKRKRGVVWEKLPWWFREGVFAKRVPPNDPKEKMESENVENMQNNTEQNETKDNLKDENFEKLPGKNVQRNGDSEGKNTVTVEKDDDDSCELSFLYRKNCFCIEGKNLHFNRENLNYLLSDLRENIEILKK